MFVTTKSDSSSSLESPLGLQRGLPTSTSLSKNVLHQKSVVVRLFKFLNKCEFLKLQKIILTLKVKLTVSHRVRSLTTGYNSSLYLKAREYFDL